MQTLGRFWQRFRCPNLFFNLQVTAYIYIYSSSAFQSKIGYALLMRTIISLFFEIIKLTSQMTQGTRRLYSEVEVKAKAEVKIVVRS